MPSTLLVVLGLPIAVATFFIWRHVSEKVRFNTELAQSDLASLEKRALWQPVGYFRRLGYDQECVAQFVALVDSRNFEALLAHWPSLSRGMKKREAELVTQLPRMGLEFDEHFHGYEALLRELLARRRQSRTN